MRRVLSIFLSFSLLAGAFVSCRSTVPVDPETPEDDTEIYYVNFFAFNAMDNYYLWIDEVQDAMNSWARNANPIEAVAKVRYKDEDGNDIDRWTQVLEDFDSFTGSVAGVGKTYGFDADLYYYDSRREVICAVVTLVYADSPAEAAGLRRGDVIMSVNGKTMTAKTYYEIANYELFGGTSVTLGLQDGSTKVLDAVSMYEDPVMLDKIFEIGGKKVGYLVYTGFTIKSCERLIEVCRSFKEDGISELILDLRYNGGGYVVTENVFASMLAPEADVLAGEIFEKEIYNAALTKEMGVSETEFETEYKFTADGEKYEFSTLGANIGLSKIYAIIDSGTASASESLLTGLMPYMDIELIGRQSHGKYCGGIMYDAQEWYDDNKKYMEDEVYQTGRPLVANWGIYVIFERYSDKDGVTPCMPDGFIPDVAAEDNPQEGYALGDPRESMLAVALSRAGYAAPASLAAPKASAPESFRMENTPRKPGFGFRLELQEP